MAHTSSFGQLAALPSARNKPPAVQRSTVQKEAPLLARRMRCRACDAKLLSIEQTDGACRACVEACT